VVSHLAVADDPILRDVPDRKAKPALIEDEVTSRSAGHDGAGVIAADASEAARIEDAGALSGAISAQKPPPR